MSISEIDDLTPVPDGHAYFRTSGFSPKLEPVTEEVIRWMRFQNRGPALPGVHEQVLEMFEQVRAKVAKAINADADEIMLNENTTVGINVVASGIDWRSGDNVILTTHEHPGNRLPWYNVARRYGVQLRYLTATADDGKLLENLNNLIDARTRVVSMSHVSRETGRRFPANDIVEMAHAQGVPVLFDGAQAFGAIPVDVRDLNCDFYTFGGHKYIMASQGTGGFYARRDRIDWLQPGWIGCHSEKEMDLEGNMTLHDAAKRFEFGTRNLADQAGFGKALDIWESVGWDRVFRAIEAYTDELKAALLSVPPLVLETPLPYQKSSGIVAFHIPSLDATELTDSLEQHECVLVSPVGANDESIRVSTHVFNTQEDLERLVAGLLRLVED